MSDFEADVARPGPGRPVRRDRRLRPPAVHRRPSARRTPGSSSSAGRAASRSQGDPVGNTVAWWGGPPAADGPRRCSPARTWTRCATAARTTGRSAWSPRWPPSTCSATRGLEPSRPLGVAVFVEEEGSRFGLACLGSRLATGATSWEQAAELRDRDGVRSRRGAGGRGAAVRTRAHVVWSGLRRRIACFVELHVEQGRDLVDRDAAVGVASGIWPHGRYRFDFTGEANHAGTTRMEDRHDPMLTYAMTVLAANKQARLSGQRATFGRVDVRPNGTNAVPSAVTAWLDARAGVQRRARWAGRRGDPAGRRPRGPGRHGGRGDAESVSPAVHFDADLRPGIAAHAAGRLAGDPHLRRPRRGHPVRGRGADRDAVRAQPDRRLPLAGRARRDGRLPGRGRGARRHAGPPWLAACG